MGKGYKPMLIFIHAGNAHNRDNFLLTLAKKTLTKLYNSIAIA